MENQEWTSRERATPLSASMFCRNFPFIFCVSLELAKAVQKYCIFPPKFTQQIHSHKAVYQSLSLSTQYSFNSSIAYYCSFICTKFCYENRKKRLCMLQLKYTALACPTHAGKRRKEKTRKRLGRTAKF